MESKAKSIEILLETSDYIVVDKPYDLCINGEKERRSHGETVASILSHQRPELVDNGVCSGFRFPHQLDYATSGALCITLNKQTTREAGCLFKERKVLKEYLALVRGHVKEDIQIIKSFIGQDSSDITGFSMTSEASHCLNPKQAESRVNMIARGYYKGEPVSKLSVQPITGRRHQIRVHCLQIGHPILGDYTYSGKKDTKPYRMMLHSWKLNIPLENQPINVTSPDPFLCMLESDISQGPFRDLNDLVTGKLVN